MAYTTINKSSEHFDTRTYSASGAGSISDVSFQPDFLWFKNRTIVGDHGLMDAVRGVNGIIHSNDSNAEVTSNGTTNITAFTSNGFTYGASSLIDTGAGTPCTWLWKANGAGSANTDGTVNSTVSVNSTSGFSIVSWTHNGSANYTVGHGLGATPRMIFAKTRSSSANWDVYHAELSTGNRLILNSTGGQVSGYWGANTVNNNTFSVGSALASNGTTMIAYCFAEKQGYSKFGRFTANGSTDNAFVYTGFKPAFVMMKCDNVTDGWSKWYMFDTARSPENMNVKELEANTTAVESSSGADYAQIDMLSNGFKLRNGSAWGPASSGNTSVYMAFAEAPLVGSNNVPCTAR